MTVNLGEPGLTAPLVAILSVWTAWGASWLVAALWSNRTAATAGFAGQGPYRLMNLIGFGLLFCAYPIDRALHLAPLWRTPDAIGWALAALALGGCLFAWWARITLGRFWSAAVTRKEGHRLIVAGPYAYVRHPIYTGLLGGSAALALAAGRLGGLIGFVVLVLGYVTKARVEERFLADELGPEGYAAYRARVPMLVPFL